MALDVKRGSRGSVMALPMIFQVGSIGRGHSVMDITMSLIGSFMVVDNVFIGSSGPCFTSDVTKWFIVFAF